MVIETPVFHACRNTSISKRITKGYTLEKLNLNIFWLTPYHLMLRPGLDIIKIWRSKQIYVLD